MNYIAKSIAAGILVGIGDIVYMVSRHIYIGAMLFSLTLLTIINSNLYLYTGKIGFLKELINTLTSYFFCGIKIRESYELSLEQTA